MMTCFVPVSANVVRALFNHQDQLRSYISDYNEYNSADGNLYQIDDGNDDMFDGGNMVS